MTTRTPFGRLAIAILLAAVATATTAFAQTRISLTDAVRQGKVKVDVKSRGGATGTTVEVEVRALVPQALHVEVLPGTVLLGASGKVQNMTVGRLKGEMIAGSNRYRPGSVMVLADGRSHRFLLEVFCLDYRKGPPTRGMDLDLAVEDQRVSRILHPPEGVEPSTWAFQLAIWMDRAGVSPAEVQRRFPGRVSEVDVRVAGQLLAHAEQTGIAEIPQGVDAEVRVEMARVYSPDPTVRRQAVEALGLLGERAAPVAPLIAANVLDVHSDKPLPATVVSVDEAARAAADALRHLAIPALEKILGQDFGADAERWRQRRQSEATPSDDESGPRPPPAASSESARGVGRDAYPTWPIDGLVIVFYNRFGSASV